MRESYNKGAAEGSNLGNALFYKFDPKSEEQQKGFNEKYEILKENG